MTLRLSILFIFLSVSVFPQSHLDTKSFGLKILDGSAKVSDDELTFQTLDSLFCKNKADKDFYFKVARKIQNTADGALGEYFSGIASKYYLEYNLEFIANSQKLTPKEIDRWLSQAAYDIGATEQNIDSLPKIKNQLDNLEKKCNCSTKQRQLIKTYNEKVFELVKQGP